MFRQLINRTREGQRGITGLETAIILIAFVVVASVFAYTVLSAGIFSAEKSKEAIHSGIETVSSSMEVVGGVVVTDNNSDSNIDQVIYTLANTLTGGPIDLTITTDSDNDGLLSDEATKTHVTVISYMDKSQRVDDIAWTQSQIGRGDSDSLLEPGEKFQITVDVSHLSPRLTTYGRFNLEMKPQKGSTLVLERIIPAKVDSQMDLR